MEKNIKYIIYNLYLKYSKVKKKIEENGMLTKAAFIWSRIKKEYCEIFW